MFSIMRVSAEELAADTLIEDTHVGRDGGVAVPLLRLEEMLENNIVGRHGARHIHVVDVLAPVAVRTFVEGKGSSLNSEISPYK